MTASKAVGCLKFVLQLRGSASLCLPGLCTQLKVKRCKYSSFTPRQDWLSLQDCVWPVVSDQVELLTRQKIAPEVTQSLDSGQQLLLGDDIVALSRSYLSGVVPERASLLEQHSSKTKP